MEGTGYPVEAGTGAEKLASDVEAIVAREVYKVGMFLNPG
jgi:hypothetical protein